VRARISINQDWRFTKGDPPGNTVSLLYDVRPHVTNERDDRPADAEPQSVAAVRAPADTIKAWILPTGNPFINEATVLFRAQLVLRRHRPGGLQEGPLLPVSGALAARRADGAHPAALDVA
jgi:hypothetical protein